MAAEAHAVKPRASGHVLHCWRGFASTAPAVYSVPRSPRPAALLPCPCISISLPSTYLDSCDAADKFQLASGDLKMTSYSVGLKMWLIGENSKPPSLLPGPLRPLSAAR
uniref:Uncharacterized protein n=1 Tax=Oryza nivara TaxID=4536 RepID=A0A0E0G6X5_ORYNI